MGRRRRDPPTVDIKKVDASAYPDPPYSLKVDRQGKNVLLSVTLHRIPAKFIVFEPSPTELVLHTLGYTTKYFLRTSWPHGVTVHAGEHTEATVNFGILKSTLPITSELPDLPDRPAGLGKRAVRPEDEESSSEEEPPVAEPPKKKKKAAKPTPAKANKKATAAQPAVTAEEPSEKQKKKKTFLSKASALDLIEEVADKRQERIDEALAKENSKLEWMEERKAVKEKRKVVRDTKKKLEKEKVREELLNAPKKKTKKAAASDALPPAPVIDENGLRSILKRQTSANERKSVSFSPKVMVKPIPRVKDPAPVAKSLREMLELRTPPMRKPNKKKSRKYRAGKRR